MTTVTSGRFILPVFANFPNDPKQQQTKGTAAGVNDYVRNEGGARGDKNLMKLVAGGVEKNRGERKPGFVPTPWSGTAIGFLWLPDRTPEEQGEQGVFSQMAGFTKQMVHALDVF